jgi:uncharacterized damage-inducible protein DinB
LAPRTRRATEIIFDQKGKHGMQTLLNLAHYNAWANQRVFDTSAALSTAILSAEAKGTYGSVQETLAHLVEVEEIYLLMLQDADVNSWDSDAFMGHDNAWFAQRSRALGAEYQALLAGNDESWLSDQFVVPWFGFPISHRDGLLQAWTHSAQHRSQILSELGSHGFQTPDIDYIFMRSQ